jgi:hypothetical protein
MAPAAIIPGYLIKFGFVRLDLTHDRPRKSALAKHLNPMD